MRRGGGISLLIGQLSDRLIAYEEKGGRERRIRNGEKKKKKKKKNK